MQLYDFLTANLSNTPWLTSCGVDRDSGSGDRCSTKFLSFSSWETRVVSAIPSLGFFQWDQELGKKMFFLCYHRHSRGCCAVCTDLGLQSGSMSPKSRLPQIPNGFLSYYYTVRRRIRTGCYTTRGHWNCQFQTCSDGITQWKKEWLRVQVNTLKGWRDNRQTETTGQPQSSFNWL